MFLECVKQGWGEFVLLFGLYTVLGVTDSVNRILVLDRNFFNDKIVDVAMKKKEKYLKVAELFAGVGGFRIGLEGYGKKKLDGFKTVWSNQWEPTTKMQHASNIYIQKFGKEGHSNKDIALVTVNEIPEHDLLVGGFPCQDYSVARVLSQAEGLVGKKGVLWWQIHRIIKEKGEKAPKFLFLENVDRLLKSPAKQRGRDFAVMLASLSDLGYIVEWRVVNAAEYGFPQRRKRVYLLGYLKGNNVYKESFNSKPKDWLLRNGLFARAFPVLDSDVGTKEFVIEGDWADITRNFNNIKNAKTVFENSGIMISRKVTTIKTSSNYHGKKMTLGDAVIPDVEVPKEYFVDNKQLNDWTYLKGAKREKRTTKGGFEYVYAEGGIVFPDPLDKPSRTIVTGEGGSSPSRFKHIIKTKSGKLRRLTPVELEKLNMFPPGHTAVEGVGDVKRAFLMGNALVVGVIEKVGRELLSRALKTFKP